MPEPHITIDTNEIRLTDDDGAQSLHVLRPSYLDGERYFWFPISTFVRNPEYLSNTTDLTASALSLPIGAGGYWQVTGAVTFGQPDYSDTSEALKVSLDCPTGASGFFYVNHSYCAATGTFDAASNGTIQNVSTSLNIASAIADADIRQVITFSGVVSGGTESGNVTLKYAQQSAVAANLWLLNGWMQVQRVA